MKTLIIYAHPGTKGHCSAILEELLQQLNERKKAYELIDLYKINYDPLLHENEHYTAGKKDISKENKRFQEMIRKSDNLIFIYPIWWSSMPAILKGWIDRVFTNHFAFKYVQMPIISKFIGGPIPKGLLKEKKSAVFTTIGAKKWQEWLVLGNRFKKIMSNDILRFCGIKNKVFTLDKCVGKCVGREKEIKKLVKKGLKYLE